MTKKYNNKKRREVIKLSASFLIALFIFSACKKDITTVGANINPNSLSIIQQDTFTVVTKSRITDSLNTDETIVSLLGGIHDPEIGVTDCGIVTELRLSSEAPIFGDVSTITVDSVVLSFVYSNNFHYGDISDHTYEVYEITTSLDKEEDYFASSNVTTTGNNLVLPGTETQTPKPQSNVFLADDTLQPMVRINLTTEFGEYLINNASEMTSNESFLNFFNGIYVKVANVNNLSPNQGTVLYLDLLNALSNMIIYYDLAGQKRRFTFNINNNCARFNKIDFDFSGTPLEANLNSTEIAQERFYMQGSHISPEIYFPYIQDLSKKGNIVINRAELILPVQDFEGSPFNPSDELFLGRVRTNTRTDYTLDYPGSGFNFTTVPYDADQKHFSFNLTREIQKIVAGEISNANYRVFPTSFFGSTIERIIFSGPKSIAKDKAKLIITYTEY